MATAQETSNKARFSRFQDASTGDAEVISKTIDELVEPDVLIHMPLPIEATGRKRVRQIRHHQIDLTRRLRCNLKRPKHSST